MARVHHLNCGTLHAPPNPAIGCHCLLIEGGSGLVLVDTGIGLADIADPDGRIGRETIEAAGFQFREADTALRQIERLGFSAQDVGHIVLTHADPDHAGGLSDFPGARVHVSTEELENLERGNPRYAMSQFRHGPMWQAVRRTGLTWYGLEARELDLGLDQTILLVPLFGHTRGHCGVAIQDGDHWLLHVGDAYYLRVELEEEDHPVSVVSRLRADDVIAWHASLGDLKRLARDHRREIRLFGYHDLSEFPEAN